METHFHLIPFFHAKGMIFMYVIYMYVGYLYATHL